MKGIQAFLKRLLVDTHGQDLLEYALMAGFVAMAAGAVMPEVGASIGRLFESLKQVILASTNTDTLSGDVPAVAIETAKQAAASGDGTVAVIRIVCATLAVALLGVIVLRRKKNAE